MGKIGFTVLFVLLAANCRAGILGDGDGDGKVGLSEAVGALRIIAGITVPRYPGDVDGDTKITLNDAISAVQIAAEMRTAASVQLFERSGLLYYSYNAIGLPYSLESMVSTSVTPRPPSYSIDTFKLEASGANFTIVSVSAADANHVVQPFFSGLQENSVVEAGKSLVFGCSSQMTGGRTADLTFHFKIRETGETFYAHYRFKSN
ncbi:MAG: hypothetical protein AB1568_16250 [Thermodesulfobacteriota bacterium]